VRPLRRRERLLQPMHAVEEEAVTEIEARIALAIERITSGQGPMRVPADQTDPDLVLADCLTEIRRLRAACTPPEGHVLLVVPVGLYQQMLADKDEEWP
jgi:hypothetical protein